MNVVVTGGGTIAPIDDVRNLTNISSGRFSAMISEACLKRKANVWHIHTSSAQLPYFREARFDLETPNPESEHARLESLRHQWREVSERLHLVPLAQGTVADYASTLEHILRTNRIDVAFLAMAVSDFEPRAVPGKLSSQADSITIEGLRTPKVIESVRGWSPDLFLVGFKLLSGVSVPALLAEAERACRINQANLTVANDLQTLKANQHAVHLVRPGYPAETLQPGPEMADALVERVFELAQHLVDPVAMRG